MKDAEFCSTCGKKEEELARLALERAEAERRAADAAAALAGTGALAVKGPDGATAPVAAAAGFAADLLSATASPESARDGLKAGVLVASAGIPGPLSLVSAARIAVSALCRGKAGAQWLQDINRRLKG